MSFFCIAVNGLCFLKACASVENVYDRVAVVAKYLVARHLLVELVWDTEVASV